MPRAFFHVTTVLVAIATLGPVVAAQTPSGAPRTNDASVQPATHSTAPAMSAQTAGLCGLTPGDVAALEEYYGISGNWLALADALQEPFHCDSYGALCDAVDVQTDSPLLRCSGVLLNGTRHEVPPCDQFIHTLPFFERVVVFGMS